MWAIHHGDGTFEQVLDKDRPMVVGARVFPIERLGDLAHEIHKPGKGWVPRPEQERADHIDRGYDVDNPGLRLIEYALKEIEARLILGTLRTDGRLAREAIQRGISVEDLARTVLERADLADRAGERIARKLALARGEA